MAVETSSAPAAATAVVGAAAAAVAVVSDEPMPSTSVTADASTSGTATRYDIACPPARPSWLVDSSSPYRNHVLIEWNGLRELVVRLSH
jgi:hypothetical protein